MDLAFPNSSLKNVRYILYSTPFMDLWRLGFLGVDVLNCIANFSYCDTFHLAIITVN